MAAMKCTLLCHSISPHVQQLYTGFRILADAGEIDLAQKICTYRGYDPTGANRVEDVLHAHLRVQVTRRGKASLLFHFDTHDAREIDGQALKECDAYFKRSFSRDHIRAEHGDEAARVFPLGLNYLVLPDTIDLLALRRNLALSVPGKRAAGVKAALDAKDRLGRFHPRLRHLQSTPVCSLVPRVLFMATAYDPHDNPDRPREKVEERIYNNEFRASCIRLLRKELGVRFYGGFNHSSFTVRNYPDVLLDVPENAGKRNYLSILREFPICIATTGLHGSIGWKMAEYVALSKAILSETLKYELPGQFSEGVNYIQFSTPEECVEESVRLLSSYELMRRIMLNNHEYYEQYIRPDKIVANALSRVHQLC